MIEEQQEVDRPGSQLALISNEMVRVYKDLFGRGPTKARTNWAGADVLVSVLEESLTTSDLNLLARGEHERLRDLRLYFQYAYVRDFCEPVERITGRRVRAFLSSIDTEADGICTEVFVLHPDGSTEPSRINGA